jgi:hypothetical protein
MSLDPLTRRFDPRRLFMPIKTDGEEPFGVPAADRWSAPRESAHDPAGRDFDEALEQIVSDKCRTCPLCGAIPDRDGTVLSWDGAWSLDTWRAASARGSCEGDDVRGDGDMSEAVPSHGMAGRGRDGSQAQDQGNRDGVPSERSS